MFRVRLNNLEAKVEVSKFPGGEMNVRVDNPSTVPPSQARIDCLLTSCDDIITLLLVKDAVDRICESNAHTHLYLNYIPYARQDRVCNKGEALSLRVFCNLVNSMNFNQVTVYDPHSDVAGALLNNVKIVSQLDCFILSDCNDWQINKYNKVVAPDAGASKKVFEIAQFLDSGFVQAHKHRDIKAGRITSTEVDTWEFNDSKVLVVDDICDGGMSFIKLAEKIRETSNPTRLDLYVTHGIFSKGKEVLAGLYDNVYCLFDWTENK